LKREDKIGIAYCFMKNNKSNPTAAEKALSIAMDVPCHLYAKDLEGKYLWVNNMQAATHRLARPEDVVGKRDSDLQDKEIAKLLLEKDLEIMRTGQEQIIEEPIILDGQEGTMISHKAPLRDSNGKIIGLVGASINIVKQKQKEGALLLALENIVSNMPGHVYWKDKDGVYLGCNNKLAQSLGLKTAKDIVGKKDSEVFNKSIAHTVRENNLRVMKTNEMEIIEEELIVDKKPRTFISHKGPLKDPETGEAVGVLGVSIDITKQKELEKLYLEKAQALAQALAVKEDFLRSINHEIKKPLQDVFGMLEKLEDAQTWDNTSDSDKRKTFQNVLRGRDKLMNVMSNLLDLSDLRKGRDAFQFGYHDVKRLITEVAQEFKNTAHSIVMDVSSDVNTYIYCDDWRISQVMRNVIANSIKHGGQNKPILIALSVLKEQSNKYLKISIKDEGVGIPEDQLEEVFELFTESSRTKHMYKGTGIGLALCKDIVIAHKGKIWAENNPDGGATFFITLPYEKQSRKIYSYRLTQRS
jgi:PAS domain S-box-containing protein